MVEKLTDDLKDPKFEVVYNSRCFSSYTSRVFNEGSKVSESNITDDVHILDSTLQSFDTLIVRDSSGALYKARLGVYLEAADLNNEGLVAYECTICPKLLVFVEGEVNDSELRDHLESHNPNAKNIDDIYQFFKQVE